MTVTMAMTYCAYAEDWTARQTDELANRKVSIEPTGHAARTWLVTTSVQEASIRTPSPKSQGMGPRVLYTSGYFGPSARQTPEAGPST